MQQTVNEAIKFLRKSKGLTQQELAEAINVSKTAIVNVENGRSNPSVKNLVLIAEYFGVKSNDLLNGNVGAGPQKSWKEEAYEELKRQNDFLQRMLELALSKEQLAKFNAASPALSEFGYKFGYTKLAA